MSYISYNFIALTAAGLLLYALLPQALRKYLLLFMSLVFVVSAGGVFSLAFLFLGILISFAGVLFISHAESRAGRNIIFLSVLALHLGALFYFKYNNFAGYTVEAFYAITGGEYEFIPVERTAPLGISFYTLMLIGYVADVYMKKCRTENSFVKFSLFTGYFGHIVQGPIDAYAETAESISAGKRASFENLLNGCLKIFFGLFKKLVISERLAVIVNTVYGDYTSFSWAYLFIAACAFSLQLYTDFSGCIDIVTGVSELFGIKISENFRQPFFSRSIAEFWRRWHITLGAFFRKYVYIPLGGNRRGIVRKYLNTTAVFFLSGLWHGGNWTFVIGTGLLHCFYMITGAILTPVFNAFYRTTGINRDCAVMKALAMIRTFLLVTVGFVFFRSDSVSMAGEILGGIFSFQGGVYTGSFFENTGIGAPDFAVLLIGLIILFAVSLKRERDAARLSSMSGAFAASGTASRLATETKPGLGTGAKESLCLLLLLSVILFGFYGRGYDASAFIYSNF